MVCTVLLHAHQMDGVCVSMYLKHFLCFSWLRMHSGYTYMLACCDSWSPLFRIGTYSESDWWCFASLWWAWHMPLEYHYWHAASLEHRSGRNMVAAYHRQNKDHSACLNDSWTSLLDTLACWNLPLNVHYVLCIQVHGNSAHCIVVSAVHDKKYLLLVLYSLDSYHKRPGYSAVVSLAGGTQQNTTRLQKRKCTTTFQRAYK